MECEFGTSMREIAMTVEDTKNVWGFYGTLRMK